MAAPTTPQSVFRYPLTIALSSEAAVRLLRELAQHGGALSPRALADRTGLTIQGVRRALHRLAVVGVVDALGGGDRRLFRLAPIHPLRTALEALFAAEARRVDAVLAAVRQAARQVNPPPVAVWLYGSVARGEDTAASDVDIAVVVDAPEDGVERAVETMRTALAPVEDAERVALALVGVSLVDVARLAAGDAWWVTMAAHAVPLVGPSPDTVARLARVRATEAPEAQRRRRVRAAVVSQSAAAAAPARGRPSAGGARRGARGAQKPRKSR